MVSKRALAVCVSMVLSSLLFAQAQITYSKLYSTPLGRRDISYGLVESEDGIVVHAKKSCWVEENQYISCTDLNYFTHEGELINTISFDTLFPEGRNRLTLFDENYYLTGHLHGEGFNRSTYLYRLDTDLNLLDQEIIPNQEPGIHNNEGILADSNFLYLYGYTVSPSGTESRNKLSKLNRSTYEIVWERIVLDSIGPPDLSLHIGTRWTYEEVNDTGPSSIVGPAVYEIIDTTILNDTMAFVVEKTTGVLEG